MIEDIAFLVAQLQLMEHAQDHEKIEAIAKKYNVWTYRNHKGKIGKPK